MFARAVAFFLLLHVFFTFPFLNYFHTMPGRVTLRRLNWILRKFFISLSRIFAVLETWTQKRKTQNMGRVFWQANEIELNNSRPCFSLISLHVLELMLSHTTYSKSDRRPFNVRFKAFNTGSWSRDSAFIWILNAPKVTLRWNIYR